MTIQAHLDRIKAKTGKTPDDFRALAARHGLTNFPEIKAWLKADFGLDDGHANLIARLAVEPDVFQTKPDVKLDKMFAGKKEKWRKPYEALVANLEKFGADVRVSPTNTYISLLRGSKKFGVVAPSSAERLDIGVKLKGVALAGRFETAGGWNTMMTHRVRISERSQIDRELLDWLKRAYDAA